MPFVSLYSELNVWSAGMVVLTAQMAHRRRPDRLPQTLQRILDSISTTTTPVSLLLKDLRRVVIPIHQGHLQALTPVLVGLRLELIPAPVGLRLGLITHRLGLHLSPLATRVNLVLRGPMLRRVSYHSTSINVMLNVCQRDPLLALRPNSRIMDLNSLAPTINSSSPIFNTLSATERRRRFA